jgi:poly-gamma-glutamate system protein
MRQLSRNHRLALLALTSLLALFCTRRYAVEEQERADAPAMRRAEDLAARWFMLAADGKIRNKVPAEAPPAIPHAGMLGAGWSEITTTLGSLEAKRTAANPRWAALMVRLLHDAGVDSGKTVGITLSGSFPSLGICTLAALQTIGARAVIVTSLGSSSFGANQPGATWLDMEEWLLRRGGLRYRTMLLTPGAEGDSGAGMSEEGISLLKRTAVRYGRTLVFPSGYAEALHRKMELFTRNGITLLVNVGGSQTSLGTCRHAEMLPNGFHSTIPSCSDTGRGIIERLAGQGVPFIHLLHVNNLAARYGLPLSPGIHDPVAGQTVFMERVVHRGVILALLAAVFGSVLGVSRSLHFSPVACIFLRP